MLIVPVAVVTRTASDGIFASDVERAWDTFWRAREEEKKLGKKTLAPPTEGFEPPLQFLFQPWSKVQVFGVCRGKILTLVDWASAAQHRVGQRI